MVTRGPAYEKILEMGLQSRVLSGELDAQAVASLCEVHYTTAIRTIAAIKADQIIGAAVEGWAIDPKHKAMLGPPEWDGDPNGEAFDQFLDEMVLAFVAFRDEFFEVKRHEPYITEEFHRRWIKEVLRSIYTGGKLLILSPPRHGKSELLIHFCVWLILRNPNIRIMWVAGNGDIAADMVGSVRAHLEDNHNLIAAYLPPGQAFKPPGRTGSWRNTGFRVHTRTRVGQKAPTMVAVGRGGKILSRDCDIIVSDDIEDHESTQQPAARSSTRSWFTTTLDSRKEEHTAWIGIGSRQHPDDVYGYLLADDEWEHIVDTAHDPTCTLDPEKPSLHKTCMLFPQLRTYGWLEGKRKSAAALGLEGHFEMVYLNTPRPDGEAIFQKEQIELCYNHNRGIGTGGVTGLQLVGGLDPSATGYQAATLIGWSADEQKQYFLDFDNRLGGGIEVAFRLFKKWLTDYNCRQWVIEENGFQRAIRQDPRIKEWASRHGVHLEGHQTQGPNKHDPLFGVGGMSRLFRDQLIDLPYGTSVARAKTDMYVRQALAFTDNHQRGRNSKTDLLMSSWFPQKVLRRWQKEFEAHMAVDYEPSFGGVGPSNISSTPW